MDVAELVKSMLLPGSLGFLLLGLTVGLGLSLAGERTRRWGLRWLMVLVALYWVLSLPATASALVHALEGGSAPLTEVSAPRGKAIVVVLGGGSETFRADGMAFSSPSEASALRAMEGARVYQLLDDPLVIASGGPGGEGGNGEPESRVLSTVLQANRVPVNRILQESRSSSTREEAILLAEMLAGMDPERVIVVTSPSHMRRALGALAATGVTAIGSPSREWSGSREAGPPLLPSGRSLDASRQALREVMALVYYAARGWLAPASVR